MLFSNANVTHSCSVDLTLQCVMSGGRGLVVWNRPPSRPQMFFCWVFFLFVCFLRLAAISWLISHQLELFLRLCTALYVPIKGIVLLSFICSTQQQLAGEVTHLWCTKRRFIKSRSYLQKYFIARAYALWFIFVTCENNDSVLVYGSLWMVSNSVKKYPLCSISLMYSCKQ